MKEQELIRRLQDRDETSITDLTRHFGPLMRYVIAPILTDPRDQEDCLSEVTERIWTRIESYDPARGSWKSWLTGICRNTALNRARGLKQEGSLEEAAHLPSPEPTPEELMLRRERQEALLRALTYLRPEEHLLFYRKYYYLQPTAQIAAEMGLTERAVEGKLYRIKKKLRRRMGGDGYDG